MRKISPAALGRAALLAACIHGGLPARADDAFTPAATLQAFAGEAELRAYFEPFAAERRRQEEVRRQADEERRQRQEEARRKWEAENPGKTWMPPPPMPSSVHPAPAPAAAAAQSPAADAITNNQVAGVDEGGIVKAHGKHLVILRRGRLFTVNVDRHQLAPVSSIDAFGPDISPAGAWYDEMLVSGNTIVVIGFSYARGGAELGVFGIADDGRLSYRGTWHLKSVDYYSSRNYASRLVGDKLVLYAPIPISAGDADPLARLPALRQWQGQATPGTFQRIAPPTRIYRSEETLDGRRPVMLHSVTTCDLAQAQLRCEAGGVLGGHGRVFHVSSRAVYVWTQTASNAAAAVFRLPLDASAPSALRAQGMPVDQFSFLEQDDGHLNVLVSAQGRGDAMWRGEGRGGNLSLLRVRVRDFGDGQSSAPPGAYQALPAAGAGTLQNRYVGSFLLYGTGSGWFRPASDMKADLQVVDVTRGRTSTLPLPHGVDRLEALGTDAVALGTDGRDLVFSGVRLGAQPSLAHQYRRAAASQGETRSHGFFYRPEAQQQGIVGLPVRGGGQGAYRQLWEEPAGMLYLHNDRLRLTEIGALATRQGIGRHDRCRASCTDWYGNARPIFLAGRVFALLGYELVEARVLRERGTRRLVELRRIDYSPGSADYRP